MNLYHNSQPRAPNTWDFSIKCECKVEICYANKMQAFQLIRGVQDIEIQDKILFETAFRSMDLTEMIKIGAAINAGKCSSGVLSKSGGINELSQATHDPMRRTSLYCGDLWHQGNNWRKLCKGTNATFNNCSKKGHLTSVCRSGRKL